MCLVSVCSCCVSQSSITCNFLIQSILYQITTGHYISYCLINGGDDVDADIAPSKQHHRRQQKQRQWVCISDETCRDVEEKEVLKCEASMLFYEKRK